MSRGLRTGSIPAVSVVIPTRNRRARLAFALRTALGQQGVEHEVVVVDDGSEDATPAFLASQRDRRLRVLRHDSHQGLAAARNTGAAAARGRWLAFLDDDDVWAPDKLASQLAALASCAGAGWCAVGSVTVDPDLRISGGKRTPRPERAARLLRSENVIPGGGSAVMVEASLFHAVGGFDTRFALVADHELWIRLSEQSELACVDLPLVGYVLHGANLSTAAHGYDAELLALEAKYSRQRPPVSVHIARSALAVRAGRRGVAVRLLVTGAVRDPDLRTLSRAAVIAAGSRVERAARRVKAQSLGGAWLGEAEQWLADLRAAAPTHLAAIP